MEDCNECSCNNSTLNLTDGCFYDMLNSQPLQCRCHHSLLLNKNQMDYFPKYFTGFSQLSFVDISNNNFKCFPMEICTIISLKSIVATNNQLEDDFIPEKISLLVNLEKLDLSGNLFRTLPNQIMDLKNLRELDLGSNKIQCISPRVKQLKRMEILYLGGNQLTQIPNEFGLLTKLKVLSLSDNKLIRIPASLGNLRYLETLSLHRNQLNALPPAIVKLKRLRELSLRNNPLVRHFVRNFEWQVPSLLELAGRSVVTLPRSYLNRVYSDPYQLPNCLVSYLKSAHCCANPQCSGVYFSSCVEHIKFKDFCGKFRMPLMAFICSPNCDNYSSSEMSESDEEDTRLNKVLLG